MEELFRSYWWLVFPLGWMVFGAFKTSLAYRTRRDTVALLKTYAESGREPPAELVERLHARGAC